MSFREVDGFGTYQDIHGRTFLLIESRRISECLDHLKTHPDYGIGVSRYYGFTGDDLGFLEACPTVKAAYIQDSVHDASGLYHLTDLNWLLFSGSKEELDLSRFGKLEAVRADWSQKLQNLESCKRLRHLALWKFKPKSRDLTELSSLERLEELEITQSLIESLSGLRELRRLRRLELSYLIRLRDISAVGEVSATLRALRFDRCKAVNDYSPVTFLKGLEELGIISCGEIPSISFLRELPNLERFSFVETNVVDGDLTHCVEHPKLKHVGFMDKRHYSHRFDELKQLVGNRV